MKSLAALIFWVTWVPLATCEDLHVPVGGILPLTGTASDQGSWVQRGLELAAQAEKNRGVIFDITFDDSHGDPKAAVRAYAGMVMKKKPAVVVSWGSGVGLALSPLVNRDGVLQMGVATASPTYRSLDDFTFRNFPSAELEARFLAHELYGERSIHDLAVLKINNDYGLGTANTFRQEFAAAGGSILFEEVLEPNGTDFRSTLLRLKATAPKVVYLAAYPNEAAAVLRQARELGINSQFIATIAALGSKTFFDLAGQGAEGLLICMAKSPHSEAKEKLISDYSKAYAETLGPEFIYVARAYDALRVIAEAARQCQSGAAECIRSKLFEVRDYSGAGGRISFDRAGDSSTDFELQRVEGKTMVAVR